jgi:uncharacterized membrane protein YeaQ/YmgE (transglycosylase-associated protein family)
MLISIIGAFVGCILFTMFCLGKKLCSMQIRVFPMASSR